MSKLEDKSPAISKVLGNRSVVDLVVDVGEQYEAATSIVHQAHKDMSGTLGVLLTLAEVAMPGSPSLRSYKDQIRREFALMRNRIQDNVYVNLKVQDHYGTPGAIYFTTENEIVR